jgi:hypothetical protein
MGDDKATEEQPIGITRLPSVALLQAARVIRRELAGMEEGTANHTRLSHVAAWLFHEATKPDAGQPGNVRIQDCRLKRDD